MASTNEEERALETQLELQLHDQRDSLAGLNEALASDPSNSELLSVSEELVQAIKEAEEGLLHLKRARLLREVDSALIGSGHGADKDVKAEEPLDPVNVEPPEHSEEHTGYIIGSKCRFRYTDGRWYNGQIVALDGSSSARISFLTPTSENMMMCKFFLQQRCRFGSNCRLSHGTSVLVSSLRKYIPTLWEKSLVGSSILAVPDGEIGLWRVAELESWDDELRLAKVVFRYDGSSASLGHEAIVLSEYADLSDEEGGSGSTSSESCSGEDEDDDDEDGPQGLGFLESSVLRRGIQKETTIFAKWENHTRGIASKMMANMGYQEGMGLGASGQGRVNPIKVRVLPAKQSLDLALESREVGESGSGKKRSRGGKRKREKKLALARAAKSEKETPSDIFTVIDLGLARNGESQNGGSDVKLRRDRDSAEGKRVDRRSLVEYDHEVKGLRAKVVKLEEMVNRNRREKVVYEAAMKKLNEARKHLADAEEAHASASNEVISREKEKKWLKF